MKDQLAPLIEPNNADDPAAVVECSVDATAAAIQRIHPLADWPDWVDAPLGVDTSRPDIEWEQRGGFSA